MPGRIVALAAEKKVSRIEYNQKDYDDTDDYGYTMKKDQKHLDVGFFWERIKGSDKT